MDLQTDPNNCGLAGLVVSKTKALHINKGTHMKNCSALKMIPGSRIPVLIELVPHFLTVPTTVEQLATSVQVQAQSA